MKEIIIDTLLDGLKILPFLFIAFLIIELIEHKFSNKTKTIIAKSGKFGPFIGGLLGLFPQCGFSVIATNLYVTKILSLGTLIAIYLTTSDEMLPILIGEQVSFKIIGIILLVKFMIGCIFGFIIDLIVRKKEQVNYDICEEDDCHCDGGIIKSTIKHTLKTLLFLLIATFIINILFEYGEGTLERLFIDNSIFTPFITSLIGLIPTCGSSIMITQLYLSQVISFGSMIAGLLTGSGVAILVLFKANKNIKDCLFVLLTIYGIGVICGIIINLLGIVL